ncbi:MAG: DNA-processing protein DprA, partial [Burkholderiaceae bacterium]
MNFELTAFDPDFPMALRETHPPVSMVFGLGSSAVLLALGSQPGLAIVGSRQATPQGLADAHWFAREIGQAGLTIISGLALGIDASA